MCRAVVVLLFLGLVSFYPPAFAWAGSATLLDPAGVPVSHRAGGHAAPAVASDGRSSLVVWTQFGPSELDRWLAAAVVSPGGRVGPTVSLAAPGWSGVRPQVSWGGGVYVVVWAASRDPVAFEPAVVAVRVSPAGRLLDPEPIVLATPPEVVGTPRLAWNGAHHLVTWVERGVGPDGADEEVLRARRIGADGGLPEGAAFVVAGPGPAGTFDGKRLGIASDGEGWMVSAFNTPVLEGSVLGWRLDVLAIDRDGGVDGGPLLSWFDVVLESDVGLLVWDGERYGVICDFVSAPASSRTLVRFDAAGDAEPPVELLDVYENIQSVTARPGELALGAAITYTAGEPQILLTRLRPVAEGVEIEKTPLGVMPAPLDDVALAWDGRRYVAVWVDFRDPVQDVSMPADIFGARIGVE